MTAEVVVMNKVAVALAADSAVTVGGGQKVFNTASKLFMLAPGCPIGLMIYNNAEFMGLPWETIVKAYRDKFSGNRPCFDTLKEYGEDFISFLKECGDELFSKDVQEFEFTQSVSSEIDDIVNEIDERIRDLFFKKGDKITDDEISEITDATIQSVYDEWNKRNNKYADEETKEFSQQLLNEYGKIIDKVRDESFEHLPLSNENKTKIRDLCVFLFSKNWPLDDYTGMVFAGYGQRDLYPALVAYGIEKFICGKLKYALAGETKVSFRNRAHIHTFAQGDVIATFMEGVHPKYKRHLRERLSEFLGNESIEKITSKVNGLKDDERQKLFDALNELVKSKSKEFLKELSEYANDEITQPITSTVAFLPEAELVEMAETLVSMTSFMRRVSMVRETVGGPVDVAIISKKDGFVWVKRKRYYDPEHNVGIKIE